MIITASYFYYMLLFTWEIQIHMWVVKNYAIKMRTVNNTVIDEEMTTHALNELTTEVTMMTVLLLADIAVFSGTLGRVAISHSCRGKPLADCVCLSYLRNNAVQNLFAALDTVVL